jgi:outer membrane protein assembly factor BamB
MRRNSWLSVLLIVSCVFCNFCICSIASADWPAFRGPTANGFAAEGQKAPTVWSAEKNICWKIDMPQPGNGSPIVVGKRVFVTSAEDKGGRKRSLYCFDASDGKKLWARSVEIDRVLPKHTTNNYSPTTPASDGKRVVVWHGSAGLHCYDLEGKPIWSRDLGEFKHRWGFGTSPIIHKGRVILHTGPGKDVFVTAIKLSDGKTLWKTDEPFEGDRRLKDEQMGSWTTPVVIDTKDGARIIVSMAWRLVAYDAENGKIVWSCEGNRHSRGALAYSAPIPVGDMIFVTGGFLGVSLGVRLGGSGDVTKTQRLWRFEKNPQNIGSSVTVGGYVYRANARGGGLDCVDPKTGRVLWTQKGKRPDSTYWGSIVSIDGLLYATSQNATTTVYKPNPKKFELVATNRLNAKCNATPAVSGGRIFIRTMKGLICIGR